MDFGISGLGVLMNSFRGQTRQQHLCHASKPSANGKKHGRAVALYGEFANLKPYGSYLLTRGYRESVMLSHADNTSGS